MAQNQLISRWLGFIVFTQVLVLLTLWCGIPSTSAAKADGIPDQGAQQQEIINQLKSSNEKLERLLALLSGGDLQVKIAKPDESKGHE